MLSPALRMRCCAGKCDWLLRIAYLADGDLRMLADLEARGAAARAIAIEAATASRGTARTPHLSGNGGTSFGTPRPASLNRHHHQRETSPQP